MVTTASLSAKISVMWVRIVFLMGSLAALMLAQTTDSKENVTNCLNGRPNCDISQLSAAEVKGVSSASRARNLDR